MAFNDKLIRGFYCLIASVALFGCAIVDDYSGRAVVYNLEAELAQNQALLLNIVRAAMRRPMQFTTVSTINGNSSAMGSANLTAPIGPHSASTVSTMFGGSVSGGVQSFAVNVLDTQEFYSGILSPIPGQLLDVFLQAGYSPELLFNLFIEKIVITKEGDGCSAITHWDECEFYVENYPGRDTQVELFHSIVRYLLNLGLATEALQTNADKTGTGNSSARGGGKGTGGSNGKADETDKSSAPLSKPFALCFNPHRYAEARNYLDPRSFCGAQAIPGGTAQTDIQARAQLKRTAVLPVRLSKEFVADLSCITRSYDGAHYSDLGLRLRRNFANQWVTVKFYTRSTEGLIYFLGELMRRELQPDFSPDPRPIQIGTSLTLSQLDESECRTVDRQHHGRDLYLENLFVVQSGGLLSPRDLAVSVNYGGTTYYIPSDRSLAGWSSQVLDITRQLLAINSSAKALPTSNVLVVAQ